MRRLPYILTLFLTILLWGCTERKIAIEKRVIVSIAPLKPLVENILGADFEVSILVPQGASPETFEPTPKQLREVESARFVFGTGLLEFEQELLHRIARNKQIINTSQGIELIAGTCSHAHHSHSNCTHNHAHGVDPHIWCSPKSLSKIAENIYNTIAREMPDSTKYGERYTTLCPKRVAKAITTHSSSTILLSPISLATTVLHRLQSSTRAKSPVQNTSPALSSRLVTKA